MDIEDRLVQKASACRVAPHLIAGLTRYISDGVRPGQFLVAVLKDNLMEAMGRADEEAAVNLKEICTFLYTHSPSGCSGSEKKVEAWIKKRGINGIRE